MLKKGCGVVCIGLVVLVVLVSLFIGGVANEIENIEQAQVATLEPVESVIIPEAPGEEEIHATLDQMTELARDEYLRSLHGLKFSMVGTVTSVDSGSHVSFSGTRFDARFRLSKEEAVALQLGQGLHITGMIESWETFLGLMVRLENVSIATIQ